MSSWSGTSVALALALAGCASDADAVVTVRRDTTAEVQVQLCNGEGLMCQSFTADPLFEDGEPTSASKLVEVYLEEDADILQVRFSIAACFTSLTIPFDGAQRTPSVVLPDTLTGCADCTLEPCP